MNPNPTATGKTISLALFLLIGSAAGPAAMAGEPVCELITESEASAAMGSRVATGTASKDESGDQLCRYIAPRQGMIAITLAEDHGEEKFAKAKAKIQSDPALTPENISDLGDQAVFANVSKGVSELLVLKGDKSIAIALSGRTANSSKEALKELARTAVSRL